MGFESLGRHYDLTAHSPLVGGSSPPAHQLIQRVERRRRRGGVNARVEDHFNRGLCRFVIHRLSSDRLMTILKTTDANTSGEIPELQVHSLGGTLNETPTLA